MSSPSRRSFLAWTGAAALAAWAAPLLPAALAATPVGSPPPLDSLTGDWLPQSALQHLPAVFNFYGGVNADANAMGITNFTLAPYVQGGSCGDLAVDGTTLTTESSRWSAYEILRKATTQSGLTVQTATRLGFEANQVLWQISVTNPTGSPVATTLKVSLNPRIRKATSGWAWGAPRPGDTHFTATSVGSPPTNVLVSDNSSPAVVAFAADAGAEWTASGTAGTVQWALTVAPGATETVHLVMAVGDTSTGKPLAAVSDATGVISQAGSASANFAAVFAEVANAWSTRWTHAFTPGNAHYSGSLPVLSTDGSANGDAIARLYYMSILSVLCCERTNLGPTFNTLLGRTGTYSGFDRVYVTGAPEYSNTTTYFWDTSYGSVILALLDPVIMRALTEHWLGKDIYHCYAVDIVQGNGVGPWYSANDLTVFSTILNYVNYSGDTAYLDASVAGATVLQHLTDSATHWQGLVAAGQNLADYGENGNLLEVLPKYTNQVASMNAANVWMMNQASVLQRNAGNSAEAAALSAAAVNLLPHVLDLYVPGEGVWNCRHADGSLVTVRTVVDFDIASNLLADKLTGTQRTEMKNFVSTELLDADWMRALSMKDSEAPVPRPDHGTLGAYASWPALAAQTFARFGDYPTFLKMLATFSGITHEGPLSQAGALAPASPLAVADRSALNPGSALTVMAWVNATSWPDQVWQASVIAKDTWDSGSAGYVLRGGAGGKLSFALSLDGGQWSELVTPTTVPTGSWHHVAAVYDGSVMTIYVDGEPQATKAQTGTVDAATAVPIVIGNSPADHSRRFSGAIDEPRVYARSLTASEISDAAKASDDRTGVSDASLLMRLPFSGGSVNSVEDRAALNPPAAVSVSAWVNATSWPADNAQATILSKDDRSSDSGRNVGYLLRGGAGGRITFGVAVGNQWVEVQSPPSATVATGGWHHVAGVYDGSAVTVYIDGVAVVTRVQTGALTPATGVPLVVGNSSADSTRTFSGSIDEARVHGRALTPAEIRNIHRGGAPGLGDASLLMRLPFSGGSVNSVEDRAALNPSEAVSVSAWVNATSWPTKVGRAAIVSKEGRSGTSGKEAGYVLRGGAGGRIMFGVAVGSQWVEVQSPPSATVAAGGWHHVAGVYDGSAVTVYIDGEGVATTRAPRRALTPATGVPLVVGNSPADGTRVFSGSIDEARVHNRALTPAEIANTHAVGLAGGGDVDPALVLRFPFDEGSGTTATEAITTAVVAVDPTSWTSGRPGFGSAWNVPSTDIGVIAGDVMTYVLVGGGKFADVIISDLFGYTPDGIKPNLKDASVPRGLTATLSGVTLNGVSHTITSSSSGLTLG
ncbi:LamG domain-containing protein [Streptomyces sp. NPDC020917]|uniref:LamG domain-containing protein n=1 Tax=Streptomyces sp. NPDC020917 TaxID=3365102 RepID=UPI0037A8EEF1